jgi:type II secretory pathway pseudopilin PulG
MIGYRVASGGAKAYFNMRLLIDSLIALMVVGILAGVILFQRAQTQKVEQCETVQQALARLQEQVLYRGALGEVDITDAGFPSDISPLWFGNNMPLNLMVPGRQPWLDVAPEGDNGDDPPDPVVTRPEQAGFWYNPNRGLCRARVQSQITERETLRLYNQLNGTFLKQLPHSNDDTRHPHPAGVLAAAPGSAPALPPGAAERSALKPSSTNAPARPRRTSLVDHPATP